MTTMLAKLGKAIPIPVILSMCGNFDRKLGLSPFLYLEGLSGISMFAEASHGMSRKVRGGCFAVLHILLKSARVTDFSAIIRMHAAICSDLYVQPLQIKK